MFSLFLVGLSALLLADTSDNGVWDVRIVGRRVEVLEHGQLMWSRDVAHAPGHCLITDRGSVLVASGDSDGSLSLVSLGAEQSDVVYTVQRRPVNRPHARPHPSVIDMLAVGATGQDVLIRVTTGEAVDECWLLFSFETERVSRVLYPRSLLSAEDMLRVGPVLECHGIPGTELMVVSWWLYSKRPWDDGEGAIIAVFDSAGGIVWTHRSDEFFAGPMVLRRTSREAIRKRGIVAIEVTKQRSFIVAALREEKYLVYQVAEGVEGVALTESGPLSMDDYLRDW